MVWITASILRWGSEAHIRHKAKSKNYVILEITSVKYPRGGSGQGRMEVGKRHSKQSLGKGKAPEAEHQIRDN